MTTAAAHEYRRSIRFADTDAAGVAHFSRLMTIVEETVHDFFLKRSVPLLDPENAWPLVSIQVDYTAPCRFQDEILVSLCLDRVGTSSISFSFQAHKSDGTVCFSGKTTLCHISPTLQCPTPIPENSKKAFESSPV